MQTKCPHFTRLMGKNELYFSCIPEKTPEEPRQAADNVRCGLGHA